MYHRLALLYVALWEFEPAEGAQTTIFVHIQDIDVVFVPMFYKRAGFRINLKNKVYLQVTSMVGFFPLKSQLVQVWILIILHCLHLKKLIKEEILFIFYNFLIFTAGSTKL